MKGMTHAHAVRRGGRIIFWSVCGPMNTADAERLSTWLQRGQDPVLDAPVGLLN
jgi:hypothetical protein